MPFDGATNPTTEIIRGAIERLELFGWCQGRTMHGAERCVFGALREASPAFGMDGMDGWVQTAMRRVEAANDMGGYHIVYWQDAPGRTKEEVIEALRRAL